MPPTIDQSLTVQSATRNQLVALANTTTAVGRSFRHLKEAATPARKAPSVRTTSTVKQTAQSGLRSVMPTQSTRHKPLLQPKTGFAPRPQNALPISTKANQNRTTPTGNALGSQNALLANSFPRKPRIIPTMCVQTATVLRNLQTRLASRRAAQ